MAFSFVLDRDRGLGDMVHRMRSASLTTSVDQDLDPMGLRSVSYMVMFQSADIATRAQSCTTLRLLTVAGESKESSLTSAGDVHDPDSNPHRRVCVFVA